MTDRRRRQVERDYGGAELLEMLSLKGAIVTIDALNCQRAIAQRIADQAGDDALALKGNQGTLHDDVRRFLGYPESKVSRTAPMVDGDDGRIETRTATLSADIDCWCGRPPTASMCQNEVV